MRRAADGADPDGGNVPAVEESVARAAAGCADVEEGLIVGTSFCRSMHAMVWMRRAAAISLAIHSTYLVRNTDRT